MSVAASSVHVLPPEVWGEISGYLDVPNVRKLLQTGNKRLMHSLQRGVQSLSHHTVGTWNDLDAWPMALWSRFPGVKTARISRWISGTSASPLRGTLSPYQLHYLPNLSKLDLADYFIAPVDVRSRTRAVLSSLPSNSLTWLSLPAFRLYDEHCALLPPRLRYLELVISSIGGEGLKAMPTDLEHLILRNEHSMTDEAFRCMPAQLVKIEVHISRGSSITYASNVLLSLPSQILSLILEVEMTVPVSMLPHLPSTLEVLRLDRARVIEDNKHGRFSLPPGILDLALGHIEGRQLMSEAMDRLPPLLRAFSLRDASNLPPGMVISIPRTVKRCVLKKARRLSSQSMYAMPPNLTHLTIGGASLSHQAIASLPSSLTQLNTCSIDVDIGNGNWAQFHSEHPHALPNLEAWTTKRWYFPTFHTPHPFFYLNLYERPTLLRTLGHAIARANSQQVFSWIARAITAYFFLRHSSWIVPSVPTILSAIFARYKNSLLGIGLAALYAFR